MTHKQLRATRVAALATCRCVFAPLQLLVLCVSLSAQQAKHDAPSASVESPPPASREMTLAVTVTDGKGRYLGGLDKEQFTIFDGGVAREITSFSSVGEPASVGVLFDISGSMRARQNVIEATRRAFVWFAQHSSPQNEYFLHAFNKNDIELADWTQNAQVINEGLNRIAPDATPMKGSYGTAIYDACAAALSKLASGSHRKRVLLIFTDAQPDNASRQVEFKHLKRIVRGMDALIYAVAMIERGSPTSLDYQGQAQLEDVAANSGGRAFFPDSVAELNEIVERIAIELSQQYMISFVPVDAAKNGELNKLKVKVKTPPNIKESLYVRSREGYFTPE
jgi:Ca-activated chloride channel family protein